MTNSSSSQSSTSSAGNDQRLLTREFLTVAAATSLYFLGMGASNPLLPEYVVDDLGGSESTAGLVVGVFAVSALVTRVGWGRLGGRRGARLLVVCGCVIATVGMAILALTDSVAGAVVARLVLGTSQAALMTGSTVLAIELAPVARRGEASSYILVAFHLGLGLGPVLGEAVHDATSYDAVWWMLGALSLAGAGVGLLLPHRPGDIGDDKPRWVHPKGVAPGLVAAFGVAAYASFSSFLPLYGETIGMDKVAPVFMASSISIAFARVVFGRLPDALGPVTAGTIALGLVVAGVLVAALWASVPGVFVAAVIMAGGMALQTPSMMPVAVDGVSPAQRASAMATFTMFMDLAVALSSPAFGRVVEASSYRTAFLAMAAVSSLGLVLMYTVLAPSQRRTAAA
ncbi:MAG: MFS transporter [Acidimicrobiales bacterium]|nr:MFS transporter [Acidimicrobiales bacterium]